MREMIITCDRCKRTTNSQHAAAQGYKNLDVQIYSDSGATAVRVLGELCEVCGSELQSLLDKFEETGGINCTAESKEDG